MSLYYSAATGGFYDFDIHGDQMPDDIVELSVETYLALMDAQSHGQMIQGDATGHPVAVERPILEIGVPTQVTMRQARLALLGAGKLSAINDAIARLPSPQKDAAQIEWEYGATVARDSKLLAVLGPTLGLDAAALDQLFIQAVQL